MSSDKKRPLAEAKAIASDFAEFVKDVSLSVCIAGSIRRQKPMVGDVEMVIVPSTKSALWNRLDVMVNMGTIAKAVYRDKNGHDSYRWGETFRGVLFMGIKIEVFTADADNVGFQTWLRTGSAEKNKYVVGRMLQAKYPVRFSDGYAWHVSYDVKHPMFDTDLGYAKLNKLRVGDEGALYRLLGMPLMPVTQREEQFYRPYFEKSVQAAVAVDFIKEFYAVGQMRMF